MLMNVKWPMSVALALVAMFIAIPSVSAADSLDSLITAAKAEGKVFFYAGQDASAVKALADGFKKKYGISAEYSRMVSGNVIQRYSSEAAAGTFVADVTMQSSSAFVRDAIAKGWMKSLYDANIPGFPGNWPEKFLVKDDGTAIVSLIPFGIAYNTDQVAEKDAPKSWSDLADPKWKGTILLSDPRSAPSYAGLFDALLTKFGPDLLKGIGSNVVRVNASMVPNLEALGAGEGTLGVPSLPTIVGTAKKAGAHIQFVFFDFTTGTDFAVGLTAKGSHPNAGRLLVHYILSEEGQRLLNGQPGAASPFTAKGLPADYQRPTAQSLDKARQKEMWKLLGLKSLL